jgi:hypothetical protein
MKVAIYARVSTLRQHQSQTIEQQLDRLQAHIAAQGWELAPEHIFRDDGYSGAKLTRPGLEHLREQAALSEFELVLITAPDRLARNYVHQVLLLEELASRGCPVEFLDRPIEGDWPHLWIDATYLKVSQAGEDRLRRQVRCGSCSVHPARTASFNKPRSFAMLMAVSTIMSS